MARQTIRQKLGYKGFNKPSKPAEENRELRSIQVAYKDEIILHCTYPLYLKDGKIHTVLFSAVTRQCTIYRTFLYSKKKTKAQLKDVLLKWASKLPLNKLK